MTVVGGGSPTFAAANPGLGKARGCLHRRSARTLTLPLRRPPVQWLNGAIGLPVALSLVIFTGGELFTGNGASARTQRPRSFPHLVSQLRPVFYMLAARLSSKVTTSAVVVNWAVSFLGNFAGALFVAWLAFAAGTTSLPPWLGATTSAAVYKSSLPFGVALARGVLCNWMVCSAVWVALASQNASGKFIGIWLLVSSFVAMGFEHSIANMFLVPLGSAWEGGRGQLRL